MAIPKIQTAIPVRRYQYGEFAVTVLDEISSPDPVQYRYLMAFVREGEAAPAAFVSCEQTPPAQSAEGRYQLRVINSSLDEVVAIDNGFGTLDGFCEQALQLGSQLLALQDEQPYPLG